MQKSITVEIPAEEIAQLETEIQSLFTEIEKANERMKATQAEILSSKSRTRAMLAEIKQLQKA